MKKTVFLIALFIVTYGMLFSQIPQEDFLVAYYKFDEGDGTDVIDSSINGANGTVEGAAWWFDGYSGSGMDFDGVDSYVECGNPDGLFDFTDEITIACWARQYDINNGEHNPWIAKGDHQWALKGRLDPVYEFFIYDGGWVTCHAVVDSAAHTGTWHHFAGTFNGQELKIFVDAVCDCTIAHEGTIATSDFTVNLGRNSENPDRFYQGTLDEVMIFEIALSEEEIQALYDTYSGVFQAGDVASEFSLQQNYPNPFNPTTQISYSLPKSGYVSLKVYDMLGKEVRSLVNKSQSKGTYTIAFDAADLPSGIYMYKLQAGEKVETKKMMLMR